MAYCSAKGEEVVLDRRFLKRSRPRKMLRVAEIRVVVSGASVVCVGLLLRLNRERFRKSRERLTGLEDSGFEDCSDLVNK